MLDNMKALPLHRVFHGIRFKVNKVDCRETINFFAPKRTGHATYRGTCHTTIPASRHAQPVEALP